MKKYLILFLIPFLVLLPSFGSSAASSGDLESEYGYDSNYFTDYNNSIIGLCSNEYQNSSIYDSSLTHHLFGNYDLWTTYKESVTLAQVLSYNFNQHDFSNYPYFIVFNYQYGGGNLIDVVFYSEDTYYVTFGSSGYFSSENNESICQYQFTRNPGSGDITFSSYTERSLSVVPGSGSSGEPYYDYTYGTLVMYQLISNYHIYDCTQTYTSYYDGLSAFNAFLNDDPNYINQFKDVNYLLYDSNGSFDYTNPINGYNGGSGSDQDGETAANNLYMQNPNWQFRNIPSFGSLLDTNSKGQAIFSGQLTDYQKQNLNNFRLDFTFNTFWSGQTFSIASDDVTQVRHDFSKSFLYQIQVPLSEFYSGGSLYSFYIDDIFANSVSNDSDQTLSDWADYYIHEYNHNTDTFRTAFTVNLIALDNSGQSGSCTAYYSYKTGTSQTTNNSMGINSNPYVDEEGNASGVTDPTQDPSGDGSGSGVGNVGDGSIVNNNNPVININNNNSLSDGDSDGLISKILLMIANNQSATSSGIEEIADTSGFVELMGATWLAVPTSWWTTLTAAFIASIGILVVGFIIKIIIGLIF